MRSLALVFVLAACGSATPSPAWPKSSAGSDDGGESLAPRPSAHELVADPEPEQLADEPIDATPAAAAAVPAPPIEIPAPSPPPSEEPATTESITIEIDDDD